MNHLQIGESQADEKTCSGFRAALLYLTRVALHCVHRFLTGDQVTWALPRLPHMMGDHASSGGMAMHAA